MDSCADVPLGLSSTADDVNTEMMEARLVQITSGIGSKLDETQHVDTFVGLLALLWKPKAPAKQSEATSGAFIGELAEDRKEEGEESEEIL